MKNLRSYNLSIPYTPLISLYSRGPENLVCISRYRKFATVGHIRRSSYSQIRNRVTHTLRTCKFACIIMQKQRNRISASEDRRNSNLDSK